jgi:hypothetical protein
MEDWFKRVCARDPSERCATTDEFVARLRAASGVSMPSDSAVRRASAVAPRPIPVTDLSMQGRAPLRATSRAIRVSLVLGAAVIASCAASVAVLGREQPAPLAASRIDWALPTAPATTAAPSNAPPAVSAPPPSDAGALKRGRTAGAPGRPLPGSTPPSRDDINLGY